MSTVDPSTDTVDEWITCLGCYAEREPGDESRTCACTEGGYEAAPGLGVLDPEHDGHWVLSRTLPEHSQPALMRTPASR